MSKIHIDELIKVCGFFNEVTSVNNHYGCNHPNQEETELQYISDNDSRPDGAELRKMIVLELLRRKYGSIENAKDAIKTKYGILYLQEIKDKSMNDPDILKTFNLRKQGKCYAYSCPIAERCNDDPNEDWMVLM